MDNERSPAPPPRRSPSSYLQDRLRQDNLLSAAYADSQTDNPLPTNSSTLEFQSALLTKFWRVTMLDNTNWSGPEFRWLENQFESLLTRREKMEYWDIMIQGDRGIFCVQPQVDDEDEVVVQEGKRRLKRLFMSMAVDRSMPLSEIYDGVYEQDRHPELFRIWTHVMDVAGDPEIPSEARPSWLLEAASGELEEYESKVVGTLCLLWRALVRQRTTVELHEKAYTAFKFLKACLGYSDMTNLDMCAGGESPAAEGITAYQKERFLEQFIQLALRYHVTIEMIEERVYVFQRERGNIEDGAEDMLDKKWFKIKKVNGF